MTTKIKTEIVQRTVEICDLCGNEGEKGERLLECAICRRKICNDCIADCEVVAEFEDTALCKECGEDYEIIVNEPSIDVIKKAESRDLVVAARELIKRWDDLDESLRDLEKALWKY